MTIRRHVMDDRTVTQFVETRDPELFREIVEEFKDRVFRLVSSILGPWADLDAEEVTQEVFLRVFRKIEQFRGDSSLGSWIYRVAYTTAINHRHLARIRLPHVTDSVTLDLAAEDDPLAAVLGEIERGRVVAILEELPDLYRTVIYLYYWQECSVAEIAEAVGAPAGTVKSYLHRARERIRGLLAKSGSNRRG